MSLWNVTVVRKDETEQWTAIVLAPTEAGARRSAVHMIGGGEDYRSTKAIAIDPYKAGTILTVQEGTGVQFRREEVTNDRE